MAVFYKQHDPRTRLDFSHTKPAYVIDDLNDLHGPKYGIITLPLHIDWTPTLTYDLSETNRIRTMYSVILREANSENEIAEWINHELLIKNWNHLSIPIFIKQAWETIHSNIQQH